MPAPESSQLMDSWPIHLVHLHLGGASALLILGYDRASFQLHILQACKETLDQEHRVWWGGGDSVSAWQQPSKL